MVDIKEAIKIMNKKLGKDRKVYSCLEDKNWYKFIISNKSGEIIGDSTCYALNKNTKEFIENIYTNLPDDLKYDVPIIKEYSYFEIEKIIDSSY